MTLMALTVELAGDPRGRLVLAAKVIMPTRGTR